MPKSEWQGVEIVASIHNFFSRDGKFFTDAAVPRQKEGKVKEEKKVQEYSTSQRCCDRMMRKDKNR